jgi:hypothetical protein
LLEEVEALLNFATVNFHHFIVYPEGSLFTMISDVKTFALQKYSMTHISESSSRTLSPVRSSS